MANGSMAPSFLHQLDIAFVPPHWGDARQDDLRGVIGQQGAAYLFGDFHFSFRRPEDGQIVAVKNLLRLVPAGGTCRRTTLGLLVVRVAAVDDGIRWLE